MDTLMPVSALNASTICWGMYSDQQKMWRAFSASLVDSALGVGVGNAGLAAAGLGVAGGVAGGAGVFSQPKNASTAKNGSTTRRAISFMSFFDE
jgi:hypothetical protein